MKSFSRVRPLAAPWTAAHQAPLSMGFSRQEYWSGGAIAFSRASLVFSYIPKVDSKQIMRERVRCRPKTRISKIGKLDFFHTESECSEIKVTLAMETELPSSGLKFNSCHLLDICVCVLSHFSWVWLFATLQTIAARLLSPWDSLAKNTGVGCSSPGALPNPGIKLVSLKPPALAGGFFTTITTWEARYTVSILYRYCIYTVYTRYTVHSGYKIQLDIQFSWIL